MQERKILRHKWFLYVTEFFSGVSLMAVELGASRLLAPYFSSSQIVWTIIIGTIMIAMALGNLWGGRAADKDPNPDRLYRRLLVAAVWIACIPLVGKYVIAGITVGAMEALNTIGSILGTFLPTFVTIPAVGTAATFLLFAGIMLALCLVYFLSARVRPAQCAAAVMAFLLCCAFGHSSAFAFWETGDVTEDESIYNYLQVKETEDSVILSTNVMFGVQSIQMKAGGLTGMYYDYALAALLLAGIGEDDAARVLILGLGTGTYATQSLKYFPGLTFEGVEIDQKIVDLARTRFDLPQEVEVTTYDGRAYLDAVEGTYDLIMVDAYQDITIPFQMSSVEFFTLVREHLRPDGVMVVNMNLYSDDEDNINAYLCDTIASVFPEVYTVPVPGTTNCELFACNGTGALDRFPAAVRGLENQALRQLMEKVEDSLTVYVGGEHILTDDKAPVEVLGMRELDRVIGDELTALRTAFREDGFAGLMDLLN